MLHLGTDKGVRLCDGMTRRDFLRAGALSAGAVGLSLTDLAQLQAEGGAERNEKNCILLFLVGGPGQLDTWDLKPDAAPTVRGPFRPIHTNVAGVDICEHFPLMARMADRYAILRSVHHEAAPIHETGHQLMQTGHLSRGGIEFPHFGSVVSSMRGPKEPGIPPFVVVPQPIGNTGVSVGHGQTAGFLGAHHEPVLAPIGVDPARMKSRHELIDAVDSCQRSFYDCEENAAVDPFRRRAMDLAFAEKAKRAFDIAAEPDDIRTRYGWNTFGQSCLLSRRLVEKGVRFVTVNMFDTVFNQTTWDCHADGGSLSSTLDDYKNTLCPMFDLAYSALLTDLHERGMLRDTLVLAMGEFGRTPQLNPRGGRDHWPGAWSVLFAGGGVRGGQVIGASDATGSEPKDRPITPMEIAASVYRGIGIDTGARIPGPSEGTFPLVEAEPIRELFC
jgi:hypothetical protein